MPNQLCPTCQAEMRYIQAGVSKTTGKPYNAFWACPNRCPKPPPQYQPQQYQPQPQPQAALNAPQSPRTQEVDWNRIGMAKAATALWSAVLPILVSNSDLSTETVKDLVIRALRSIDYIQKNGIPLEVKINAAQEPEPIVTLDDEGNPIPF